MFRSGAHPFIAADHVGDLHQMVIDNVCEMIGGKAIRFQQYLIIDIGPRVGDAAFDGIFIDAFSGQEALLSGSPRAFRQLLCPESLPALKLRQRRS